MICPNCKSEDSIEIAVDAYVMYAFSGFNEFGAPKVEGLPLRTDEFDDALAICQECGAYVDDHGGFTL
jgi:hypothetical protein